MRRRFAVAAGVLAALLVAAELAFWLGHRAARSAGDGGSCVVLVLGYPTRGDGSAHPIQRLRVEAGVSAHRENGCASLVLSGAAVSNEHVEAETMARIARELGVPDAEVVIEDLARSTWENIGCAAPYLSGHDRVLIVSDALHAHRGARYACRQDPSLCPKVFAIAWHRPLRLLWWKLPAALYELHARLRQFVYASGLRDDAERCSGAPVRDGGRSDPGPA